MRIATVLTPLNESNLRLARQVGVTDIVVRFTSEQRDNLAELCDRVAASDLSIAAIEGHLPLKSSVFGLPERDRDLERLRVLIDNMGAVGIPVLCYNFMPQGDMTRTRFDVEDRGGALVSAFDASEVDAGAHRAEHQGEPALKSEDLWAHLEYFLAAIVPVAESAGVKLAMHPDDPPGLDSLGGQPRIMGSVEDFERLIGLNPSAANGVCFCQGCFSEMGVDVVAAIHRLRDAIHYVHFRDVVGCTPRFRETFHDCGQTNMVRAMRAYREIGYDGVLRPDHVPLLEGEAGAADGYSMAGRLFAIGYMRGLLQAVADEDEAGEGDDAGS